MTFFPFLSVYFVNVLKSLQPSRAEKWHNINKQANNWIFHTVFCNYSSQPVLQDNGLNPSTLLRICL
jgi:hypothetical protein